MSQGNHITVAEAGRRGGLKTARRGSDFYREIGRKGGQRTKELYARLLRKWGRKGGRPKRPYLTSSSTGEEAGK